MERLYATLTLLNNIKLALRSGLDAHINDNGGIIPFLRRPSRIAPLEHLDMASMKFL